MVFSSVVFLWVFLPTVFVVYRVLGFLGRGVEALKSSSSNASFVSITLQNIWLLIASLVFYAWGEPKFVFIMIASILINYLSGLVVAAAQKRNTKRLVLATSVLINLGILGYFKYFSTAFALIGRITAIDVGSILNIALPIGISFYTFQAISYVVDVYREISAPQKNLLLLALYITLFPQLVAGPIVKYREIDAQLKNRTLTTSKTFQGIRRFIYGLAKKVLIANQLAVIVDVVFEMPAGELSTGLAWAGALMYALQIYYDFSGYSDMAIGLGLMFGFRFPENFNLPYLSRSIQEFWRRWHISLSTWFKEYLYIPLGGNRKGNARTYVNLFVVFLATGIWHGAGLSFIVWGLYHGFFMIVERVGLARVLNNAGGGYRYLPNLYLIVIVVVGWVFFRADSLTEALVYLSAMFSPAESASYNFFEIVTIQSLAVFAVGALLCGPLQAFVDKLHRRNVIDFFVREINLTDECEANSVLSRKAKCNNAWYILQFIFLMVLFAVCMIDLVAGSYNPFIYFRF